MQIDNRLIQKETIYFTHNGFKLSDVNYDAVKDVINNMPTAYDPDKVVEQLEDRSEEYNSGVRLHGKPEEMLTDDAIEIVKGGGVK